MKQAYPHKVYDKVRSKEFYDKAGEEPARTKWVENDEGDKASSNIRTRLVAQEFLRGQLERICVATPPWESTKMLLSFAVTEGLGYGPGWHYKVDFIDTKRECFYAHVKRNEYIQVPMKDHEEGMCGKLGKSIYGTREASLNWEEYMRFMTSVGFIRGQSSP